MDTCLYAIKKPSYSAANNGFKHLPWCLTLKDQLPLWLKEVEDAGVTTKLVCVESSGVVAAPNCLL